ncbi:hypothetical protein SAMN00777080_1490 [Aquiflexum balticum DSM 16537]|uniref:Uncharacterized protein n=1 Tax=Aquiflexum balticum DSM 16537 TaxID=758820 RepID=A0A1W2H210_9BACT|nr:hypothetical protein [Aquiflexum balticum]SMD42921.1 hypothetical protein SAMN00777080_1490 [Aquiflexum balticum DSM 16537]
MIKSTKISSKGIKSLPFLGLFCLFLSFASFAQNERDRNIPDMPRNIDAPNHFENSESSALEPKTENFQKQSVAPARNIQQSNNLNPVKKEPSIYKEGGEKEMRKEGMSTLSFNLFLYIVDKFKED